jgi:ATP phosphoribosyltransferase
VPQAWIDVRCMADLDDVATAFRLKHERKMRLATKYANLARGFFAEHGVVDYRIVESSGATEAAPAAGSAEFIVDITTTGATLAANGLKVIEDGVILRSQANLVPRGRPWDRRSVRPPASCSTASPRKSAPARTVRCARALPA